MNGVEQNPYTVSKVVASGTRHLSGVADRFSLRAFQSLFLAVLFCLSFLFVGGSVRMGIADAADYTVFFVTEYPFLTAAIVLWNGLLRGILLPRPQLRTVWLPLVAGVVSFLSFNSVYFRIDAINQMIFPQGWALGTVELVSMGIVPSFIGILVEGAWHGMQLLVKRNMRESAG